MTNPSRDTRWTRDQIRQARMALLRPLLERAQIEWIEAGAGNYTLPDYPGLIVKDSYWRWPNREMAGNAIDFFVKVKGLTFQQAMKRIIFAEK
jgi:hypothetical protein